MKIDDYFKYIFAKWYFHLIVFINAIYSNTGDIFYFIGSLIGSYLFVFIIFYLFSLVVVFCYKKKQNKKFK